MRRVLVSVNKSVDGMEMISTSILFWCLTSLENEVFQGDVFGLLSTRKWKDV